MAKVGKRSKSGEVKNASSPRGKGENLLTIGSLAEESWNPCLAWIVGKQSDDFKHVEALNLITLTGLRRLFSVVTKDLLLLELKELGNPKGVKKEKGKDQPQQNIEIYEICKHYLENNEPFPTEILAKVIKWKLLSIKTNDMKRREAEVKPGVVDKKKRITSEAAKSPKRGGKKTPEIQVAKESSKLRKRGEEDDDAKYIDDEPDDGAQQYIFISGFHDPQIFQALEFIGVPVTCIIRLSTQSPDNPSRKTLETETNLNQIELTKEICLFWKNVLPLLQSLPDSSHCHDIAMLDYEIKSFMIPTDFNDAEQKVQFSLALFEEIAVMLYNLLDAKRLYGTYISHLNLINVPVFGAGDSSASIPAALESESVHSASKLKSEILKPDVKPEVKTIDMRYYNDLMNCIPQESVSVTLIMNCMLEQVIATEKDLIPPSERPLPSRSDGLHFNLASYLATVANKLALPEKEYAALSEVLELPHIPPEVPAPPQLLSLHDSISTRTAHLYSYYNFDPMAVEKEMLQFLPFAKICDLHPPSTPESKERAVRLQELLHYCASDGLTRPEIDRAFKQFVFESMDLTSTDPNGFLLKKVKEGLSPTAIPWDDPYPFFKIMVPDVVELKKTVSKDVKDVVEETAVSDVIVEIKVNLGPGSCQSPVKSTHTSAESKKGILLKRDTLSATSSKKSQTNSVHFDVLLGLEDNEANFLENNDAVENTFEEGLLKMIDIQQRNLDQWCFAEHYKPHILQQVLIEASYYLPVQDTYHHKRDNSILLVLHNPFTRELQNHIDWHKEIHSNMGFRNYLEYTAESISDWLKEKEAEYQARLLSKEVDSIFKEEEEKAKEAEKAEKVKRIKSPQRSASRSKSPGKSASAERAASVVNPYIRQGSLKAQQAEMERIAKEEEEKEKQKADRRSRSSQLKERPKEDKDKVEKEKQRSPRSSAKSSKSALNNETEATPKVEPTNKSKYWPFHGYNTGNKLIHVSGLTTTLFPSDGGQIKIERTEFAQGTTSVRSSVLKDGHIFTVHVLNPEEVVEKPAAEELANEPQKTEELPESQSQQPIFSETVVADIKPEQPEVNEDPKTLESLSENVVEEQAKKPEKVEKPMCQFGSVTAVLSDGMVLAFSNFGPSGKPKFENTLLDICAPEVVPVKEDILVPVLSATKTKKEVKKQTTADSVDNVVEISMEDVKVEEEKKEIKQEFQEIFVTCPDGLQVLYYLQSSIGVIPTHPADFKLAVKQSYPFKTSGFQECEASRFKYLSKEVSRTITPDGNVVKMMVDGSVEVLSADGSVSVFTGKWGDHSSRPTSAMSSKPTLEVNVQKTPSHNPTRIKSMEKRADLDLEETVKFQPDNPHWTITYPNGERVEVSKVTGIKELPSIPVSLASDPDTQQTMATRDDHVVTVSFPDGTTITEHSDGTRITVYYRDTPVAVDTDDHDSSTLNFKTYKFIKVECPTYATVEFNAETSENLTVFGSGTSINVFPDGYYILHHSHGGRIEVDTEGTFVYYPRRKLFIEHIMPERPLQYILRHKSEVIIETEDADGHVFHVKTNGDFTVTPPHDEEALSDLSDEDLEQKIRKIIAYNQHAPRFFIIHADGSGTELLRFQDVAEYLSHAELNPATAVLKEPMPDYPGVIGITILKPFLLSMSDKWFKKYEQASIIPSGIRCRDLINLPAKEVKKPGPKFGTNVGKGLNIGTLAKAQNKIPILKCPNKLELRQLIQYKPMTEQLRNRLKTGVLKYSEAVVARMRADNLMQIDDPRSEEGKMLAEELSKLSCNQQDCDPEHVKMLYEKAVTPSEPSPPHPALPKRSQADWEKDKREKEEELKNKSKLKDKKIEKYFESEIGRVFLLSQANDAEDMMRLLADDKIHHTVSTVEDNSVTSFTPNAYFGLNTSQSQRSDQSMMDTYAIIQKRETPGSSNDTTSMTVTPCESLRPYNPTPAHATGLGNCTPANLKDIQPEHRGNVKDSYSSPRKLGKVQLFERGKYSAIMEMPRETDEQKSNKEELTQRNPLKVNVVGQPRTEPVPLPMALKGGRPGAKPNTKFQEIEEPVKRKVKTSLVTGATPKGSKLLQEMKGLSCQPERVDFGVLKEGCTYAYNIFLRNTGIDSCRFKVTQPPPATGLKVLYQPGPIAAGMSANLTLELYAIANGVEGESGIGELKHSLEIISEIHSLEIPIAAIILTADEYERTQETVLKESRARLISNKPPGVCGIIRQRKDQRISVT